MSTKKIMSFFFAVVSLFLFLSVACFFVCLFFIPVYY